MISTLTFRAIYYFGAVTCALVAIIAGTKRLWHEDINANAHTQQSYECKDKAFDGLGNLRPSKSGRQRSPRNPRQVALGCPYGEAVEIITKLGCEDLSDKYQTEPMTRIIVTLENYRDLIRAFNFPDGMSYTEIKQYLDQQYALSSIGRPMPNCAKLSWWKLPSGAVLEIYATGEEEDRISVQSMTLYPDGPGPLGHEDLNSSQSLLMIQQQDGEISWRARQKEAQQDAAARPGSAP